MAAAGEEGAEGEEVPREPVLALDEEVAQERQQVWNDIFADFPANKVKLSSIEERKAKLEANPEASEEPSLTYGETDFALVNHIISMLKNQHTRLYAGSGIFLDLGSGCGKACVAAGLIHPFEKIIGIETMDCLDQVAQKANEKYKEIAVPGDPPPEKPEIKFVKGDFVADFAGAVTEEEIPKIAVAFAVATCYGEAQLEALAKIADKMADNALFVTFSQELPNWVIGGDKKLPQERYRDHLKEVLSKRGTDPAAVVIDPNPPDAKPGGWRLIHDEEVKMPVGGAPMELPTKLFVFKKHPLPQPDPPQEEAEPAEPP